MVWPLNGIHTCEVGKGLKGDDWATGPDFIECTWSTCTCVEQEVRIVQQLRAT